MKPPPGTPDYPPRVQRWRFADPPVQRRWFWAAVVAGPLAVLLTVTAFVGLVVLDQRDSPGLIDDLEVSELVTEECETMTTAVEGLPLVGGPQERAATVRSQTLAVVQMVERIRSGAGEIDAADRPLDDWLDDWDALIGARTTFAAEVAAGDDTEIEVPLDDDGEEITVRMNRAAMLVCEVPDALLEPEFADSREV